jgi:hypothetical protein
VSRLPGEMTRSFTAKNARDAKEKKKLYRKGRQGRKGKNNFRLDQLSGALTFAMTRTMRRA